MQHHVRISDSENEILLIFPKNVAIKMLEINHNKVSELEIPLML